MRTSIPEVVVRFSPFHLLRTGHSCRCPPSRRARQGGVLVQPEMDFCFSYRSSSLPWWRTSTAEILRIHTALCSAFSRTYREGAQIPDWVLSWFPEKRSI